MSIKRIILFVVFAGLAAGFAAAQDFSYIVTASRVEEDALQAPAHVTVIDSEDIAASGKNSVVEVLAALAGVGFRSFSSEAQAEISMRGFGENSHGRVLVLMDGRRLNNPDMRPINWLSIPLANVERIEVLRGPSGVLYGNHAVGGVVNIITTTPDAPLSLEGSFGFASHWTNRQSVTVGLAGAAGGLSASAEHYATDGYRERSGYRSANAALKGHYDVSDRLTLTAGASFSDIFYEMPGGLTASEFQDDPRQARRWDSTFSAREANLYDEARSYGISATLGLTWEPFENIVVELPLSYDQMISFSDMVSWSSYSDRTVHSFGARPMAGGDLSLAGLPLRLTGGLDISGAYLDLKSYSDKDRRNRTNDRQITKTAIGPYLSARLSVLDWLSLETGARLDTAVVNAGNDSILHQALVWDAGLTLRPSDGSKLYLRYATLFRYPFTDEQASVSTGTFWDVRPERGFNVETGAALRIAPLLDLAFDLYFMQMEDEIAFVNTFTPPDFGYNTNLDQTRRIGGNLTLSAFPADWLGLRAAYGYVNAFFSAGANEGKKVPLVPEHSLDLSLELRPLPGLSAGPSFTWRSDSFQGGDTANTGDTIDSYHLIGLAARFESRGGPGTLAVHAAVENLLNLSYAPYVTYGAYYPAAGRTIKVSVSYRH